MSEEIERAFELLRLRRPAESARIAMRVLATNPARVDAYEILAFAKNAMNDRAGAIESAEQAIVREPQRGYSHYVHAYVLRAAGRHEDAMGSVRRAIATAPELSSAHDLLARLLDDRDEHDAALEASANAIALQPRRVDYLALRAAILEQMGCEPEAIATARAGLAIEPDHAQLNALFGRLHLQRDPELAANALITAMRSDPNDAGTRTSLLEALRRRHRVFRAALVVKAFFADPRRERLMFACLAVSAAVVLWRPETAVAALPLLLCFFPEDLANALLVVHPIGRRLLPRRVKFAAITSLATLLLAAIMAVTAIVDSAPHRLDRAGVMLLAAFFFSSAGRIVPAAASTPMTRIETFRFVAGITFAALLVVIALLGR